MATDGHSFGFQAPTDPATVVRAVTVIMGAVVGLTFLFGFGNILNLALRLGVPLWVAPLVAPAVDLSIVGLLLATRHLALTGASNAAFNASNNSGPSLPATTRPLSPTKP